VSALGARTGTIPGDDPPGPEAGPPAAAAAAPERSSWAAPLARNLAWNAASELAGRGASLWLAFACARFLPVTAFGRFSFAVALTQYAWLAGDATANSAYATREVARVRATDPASARRLKSRILFMRLAAAVAITAVFLLGAAFVPMPSDLRGAVAGASVYFVCYAAFPDWALRAREDFRGLAMANLAGALALVAGTLLWLPRHPGAGVAAALWGGSFAASALVSMFRLLPGRAFARGQAGAPGAHARRSLVFSIGAMAGISCAQAPLLLVGLLATPLDGGLFSAGYRFLLVVINVFSVLWWPLMPVLVRSKPGMPDFRDALSAMGGVVMLLGFPAALAFALWPSELLTLAFGARYAAGAPALRMAAVIVPIFALNALLEQVSIALGREGVRARVNVLALVVMVATGVALVPGRGPAGASIALVSGYAVSAAGYVFALRRSLPWNAMAAHARQPVALNAALALAWLVARALHVPAVPALGVAAIAYVLAAVAGGSLAWFLPAPKGARA